MRDFKSLGIIEKLREIEDLRLELSPAEIKAKLSINRFDLSHYQRLSNRLIDISRYLIEKNHLSEGHAKAIGRLKGEAQETLARTIIQKRLSVRQAEAEAKAMLAGKSGTQDSKYYEQLSETISEQLGHPTKILPSKSNQGGEIVIRYFDLDDFENTLERLKVRLNQY